MNCSFKSLKDVRDCVFIYCFVLNIVLYFKLYTCCNCSNCITHHIFDDLFRIFAEALLNFNLGAFQTRQQVPINARNGENKTGNVRQRNWRFLQVYQLLSTLQLLMLWVAQHAYWQLFLNRQVRFHSPLLQFHLFHHYILLFF